MMGYEDGLFPSDPTPPDNPRDNEVTNEQRWIAISIAWQMYCREGAGAFDWDNDSRDLMRNLTGYYPFMGPDADPLPMTTEPS